jgi:hypothetical protein
MDFADLVRIANTLMMGLRGGSVDQRQGTQQTRKNQKRNIIKKNHHQWVNQIYFGGKIRIWVNQIQI